MLLCQSSKRQKFMCIPMCSPNDNCLNFANGSHQKSLSNLSTDNYGKSNNKITYEISLNDSSTPLTNINNYNKYPRSLKNSASYLHKLKSKPNPYLKIRRNNSNEDFVCKNQNDINDSSYNYLDNNYEYSNNHSNYNIKKNSTNEFSFLRKKNDRDNICNRINGKRSDLLDKIKSMSNRINKAIGIYQDKNTESPIYNDSKNEYNFVSYSNGGVDPNEKYNNDKSKPKNSGINYDKIDMLRQNYNKKNKFLEKMKKNSEREKKLIDLKINNLSGVIKGNNIYNRIGNNLSKLKKEKPDYDTMFNDKNQYLNDNDNNIINSDVNNNKQNIYKDRNNISYNDKNLFNNNYKNKLLNENSNLINDVENSLYYNYNRNNDDSFNENNQKKDTSIRIHYGRNYLNENDGGNNNFKNDNNNNYYKRNNDNLDYANNLNNYGDNNIYNNKKNINRNEYLPNNEDEALNNGKNNNDFQKNYNSYYDNRNINKNVNNKYNYIEEGDDANCINDRKYPNEYNDKKNSNINRKNSSLKRNNHSSVDNIFDYNKKYIDKFNNDYNIGSPASYKNINYLNKGCNDENNNNNKVNNKYRNNSFDHNNDLNFNYDDYINNNNFDFNDLDKNKDNQKSKNTYVINYSINKNQEQYNDPNGNQYNDINNNNYGQNNDINDLVKYTDKKNNNKNNYIYNNDDKNNNDNENYIEEESVDIYNRSFSDYLYNTDKKSRDRYNNNYYEEIIHTKRYKDYMLSSADEDIPRNKSLEIRRRYHLHPYKSKIRNNSENHRRVFLNENKNNYSNNYRPMIHNFNFNEYCKEYGKNYNYDNICNKRYFNRGCHTHCFNPCCCRNFNCENYIRRCKPRFISCGGNRNNSQENIDIINKKIEKDNNYCYDNINPPRNKTINASSNYYEKRRKKLKENNRLVDIINESNDFPNKINQKRNISIEVDSVLRNKKPDKIIKNEDNIIPIRNLEKEDEFKSNIITKKNVYEKYTYSNIEENNKNPKLKELEDEINKLKSDYATLENKYNKVIKENEKLTKITTKNIQIETELKEFRTNLNSFKRKNNINEAKIKKLETTNQELLSKLRTSNLREESKDNSLKNESRNILNENRKLKEQIKRLELENKNMTYINKENKKNFDELLVRYNELLVKFNNLNLKKNEDKIDRTNPIFSVKKDEKYNNHLILTVKKIYGKLNKDIDELNSDKDSYNMKYKSNNTTIKKYINKDDDFLNNPQDDDYERLEAHYKILKNENQRLKMELNKLNNPNINNYLDEINTNNNNDINNNSNEVILSYNKIVDQLNNEISSLKEMIENYKKEIKELRDKTGKKNMSNALDDELVIVNKETTLNKDNNNMEITNNVSVKKNLEITDGDLNKYHEIIQDLNNLVLIYENFFFKRDVKPKNNSELQCVLIVEYIKKKIRKIKLNTLINLIIYKNSLPKKNDNDKNTGLNGESNDI